MVKLKAEDLLSVSKIGDVLNNPLRAIGEDFLLPLFRPQILIS